MPRSGLTEFRFVLSVAPDPAGCSVTLDSPLSLEHLTAMPVNKRDPAPGDVASGPLDSAAASGGCVAFVTPPMANFNNRTQIVVIDRPNDHTQHSQREVRRIGLIGALPVAGAFANYPAGSVVVGVDDGGGSARQAPDGDRGGGFGRDHRRRSHGVAGRAASRRHRRPDRHGAGPGIRDHRGGSELVDDCAERRRARPHASSSERLRRGSGRGAARGAGAAYGPPGDRAAARRAAGRRCAAGR